MRRSARSVGGVAHLTVFTVLAIVVSFALAGCSPSDGAAVTYPVGSVGPDRTVSPAVALTRGELARVLGEKNLILADTISPYRPPESASLASAPRAVYQVTLPADPTGGYIVVYEFPDTARAAAAAAELQAYLATGPGAVQSPQGTVHVIRQIGTTVVYHGWIPGEARDPGAAEIQAALETLGSGFPVPG